MSGVDQAALIETERAIRRLQNAGIIVTESEVEEATGEGETELTAPVGSSDSHLSTTGKSLSSPGSSVEDVADFPLDLGLVGSKEAFHV